MAIVVKVVKTLRNHWKKSTFAAVLLGCGANFAAGKYETSNLMRAYCEEAKKFGDIPLPTGKKPRHITVVLNPAAKDGKGKQLFEKYAAPLFHLAGIRISLINTEHEGQAKGLLEVMDNTDAVIVAGGDGTLCEAVTGLLRRPDRDIAVRRFPIGIVPIGKTNNFAKALFWERGSSEAKLLAESAMAVIKEVKQLVDVMQIENDTGQTVYALGKLDWGVFRDTESKISKYWYLGPMKSQLAFAFASLKEWPPLYEVQLSYTPPCKGCSKCYEAPSVQYPNNITSEKRWWHVFVRSSPTLPSYSVSADFDIDYSCVTNDNCGNWLDGLFSGTQLTISTENIGVKDHLQDPNVPALSVSLVPKDITRTQFLTEGLHHLEEGQFTEGTCQTFQAKEIQLIPTVSEGEAGFYTIDSEQFEVNPIQVKLLPKKVYVYCKR